MQARHEEREEVPAHLLECLSQFTGCVKYCCFIIRFSFMKMMSFAVKHIMHDKNTLLSEIKRHSDLELKNF